jgi:hypothetical protein
MQKNRELGLAPDIFVRESNLLNDRFACGGRHWASIVT